MIPCDGGLIGKKKELTLIHSQEFEAVNTMEEISILTAPRFENGKEMLIAGLRAAYNQQTSREIPEQWRRWVPLIDSITNRVNRVDYGVCLPSGHGSGDFDYISGVEVSGADGLPEGIGAIRVPALRYAVFQHDGHVSEMRQTFDFIFGKWLPASGYELAKSDGEAPGAIERYGEEFDPGTGTGGIEIWIPMARVGGL